MPGRLSTHVLDTANGRPAVGVRIELHRLQNGKKILVVDTVTNGDGRTDQPLLEGANFVTGRYRLLFHVGDYFARVSATESRFLDVIPVLFKIESADSAYHIPLLVSPWSYSTYRGS